MKMKPKSKKQTTTKMEQEKSEVIKQYIRKCEKNSLSWIIYLIVGVAIMVITIYLSTLI